MATGFRGRLRVAAWLLLLGLVAAWLGTQQGWRPAALWGLGGALGLVLFHATFSFAGGFRRLLAEGRGA
ncbi:MAG: hypothetical protein RLZZ187_3541, partial [Pseudomonadota bacterium]